MTSTEKLAFLRKKNGFTQDSLAEKLAVSRQAVSLWERGDTSPSAENLRQLSELYGVSLDYLMNDSAPEPGVAVAVMEKPEQAREENPRWRKPLLAGVFIGLTIAAVITLLIVSFSIGYEKGVKDTTPTYPVYEDVIDEADIEGTTELFGW